ncbi:MAG: ATP-binding protein [Cyanothece sp. SIO1E1]|nr:ATP-binding protein [Cyanothece sp. SIO1E1]
MLYLIGGASRSGKTLLARRILKEKQIPYLSLDWLMMGFNDGIPEYGIHHLLWPNEIAKRIWPFLKGMIDNMLFEGVDYVIEGEAMLPELIAELIEKYPGQVRAIFMGYTDMEVDKKISLVKKHRGEENDWLMNESNEYIRDHISNMISYSKRIKEDCEKYHLPYFDLSSDFDSMIEKAKKHLVAGLR